MLRRQRVKSSAAVLYGIKRYLCVRLKVGRRKKQRRKKIKAKKSRQYFGCGAKDTLQIKLVLRVGNAASKILVRSQSLREVTPFFFYYSTAVRMYVCVCSKQKKNSPRPHPLGPRRPEIIGRWSIIQTIVAVYHDMLWKNASPSPAPPPLQRPARTADPHVR